MEDPTKPPPIGPPIIEETDKKFIEAFGDGKESLESESPLSPRNVRAIRLLRGLVGDRDPVSVLRQTPAALSQAIQGLSGSQLRTPERPGKWSIVEILQHLADSEIVLGWRMRLARAMRRTLSWPIA